MDKADQILQAIERLSRSMRAEMDQIRSTMATKEDVKKVEKDVEKVDRKVDRLEEKMEHRFDSLVSNLVHLAEMKGQVDEQSKFLQLALAGRIQRASSAE